MNKIEDYINTLDVKTMHIDPNVVNGVTNDVMNAERIEGIMQALISAKPMLSPHIISIARTQMQMALLQAKPALAEYMLMLNDNAIELTYIEQCRLMYGETFVNECLEDARTSPRTFYHCVQLRLLSQRLSTSFTQAREAFAALGKAFAEGLQNAIDNMASDLNEAANRAERRKVKHGTRRMKEGDQRWARRNNDHKRRQ